MRSNVVFAVAGLAVAASMAQASTTIATFADPSPTGATPLFQFNGTFLSGGWSGSGLTLQTPGSLPFTAAFPNAQFNMTNVGVITTLFPPFPLWILGPGAINFTDSSNNPLLTVSFTGATLTSPNNFGSSDFAGQNVTFSGPILAGYQSITNETFSFSFANPFIRSSLPNGQPNLADFTATASFTSSADVVIPAPGALALLGLGGLAAARRRR